MSLDPKLLSQVQFKMEAQKMLYQQARKQQGLGKLIISVEHSGCRFIAVGSRLYHSTRWKTFHDFLHYYIDEVLTADWGNAELKLPYEDRHPVVQWREKTWKYLSQFMAKKGEVYSADMIGAVDVYTGLAYNLYLLAHNEEVQQVLLNRLRQKDQFQGAHYETIVAATFIKAGFKLEFEDEGDPSSSHCEFIATHELTGKKFSIEAKSRSAGKRHVDVGNQLHNALKKRAAHPRVVFIDINVPNEIDETEGIGFFEEVIVGLRRREGEMRIKRQPAPAAYIFLTNYAYGYHLDDVSFPRPTIAEGFKIPSFKQDSKFSSLQEALQNEKDHREMFDLMESISTHNSIPSTFDGEIPEYAFRGDRSRLLIGNKYAFNTPEGEKVGKLTHACVMEAQSLATGTLVSEDKVTSLVSFQLSEDEMRAYHDHPETFFGACTQHAKRSENPAQLFHFFHEVYRNTPKETLIGFMKGGADVDTLSGLSQDELSKMYCERLVDAAVRDGVFDQKQK